MLIKIVATEKKEIDFALTSSVCRPMEVIEGYQGYFFKHKCNMKAEILELKNGHCTGSLKS